jgi:peroxiredoxin Q/BCP
MYGKKYMGIERSSFLIGTDGNFAGIYRKVKPAEHTKILLAGLGIS